MNKNNLNQIINTLANIGVIAGILFLAFEVRQYDQQLKSQSRLNFYDSRVNGQLYLSSNPEIIEIALKVSNKNEVSEVEYMRILNYVFGIFTMWEYEFLEVSDGRLSIDEFNFEAKKQAFYSNMPYGTLWEVYRQSAPQDFVEFMEENIITEGAL